MTDLLKNSELEHLRFCMPLGWWKQIGPSLTLDEAMGYVRYLQELLSAERLTVHGHIREPRVEVDCHKRIRR
jgi:hypothetical protein